MKPTLQKVIAALVLITATSAWAIDSDKASEQDFVIRQQNLLDRYEDYYTRLVIHDRDVQKRERGSDEMRVERQKLKAEYEKIRREFKRPRREENAAAELEYNKEVKENKKALDRARAEYVRQRQVLEKMESGASRIPDNEELGIMPKGETL